MKVKKINPRFIIGHYDGSGNFGEFETEGRAKKHAEEMVLHGFWKTYEDKGFDVFEPPGTALSVRIEYFDKEKK